MLNVSFQNLKEENCKTCCPRNEFYMFAQISIDAVELSCLNTVSLFVPSSHTSQPHNSCFHNFIFSSHFVVCV